MQHWTLFEKLVLNHEILVLASQGSMYPLICFKTVATTIIDNSEVVTWTSVYISVSIECIADHPRVYLSGEQSESRLSCHLPAVKFRCQILISLTIKSSVNVPRLIRAFPIWGVSGYGIPYTRSGRSSKSVFLIWLSFYIQSALDSYYHIQVARTSLSVAAQWAVEFEYPSTCVTSSL